MILLVFLFGLTIGSFLNVCIYRIPKGESISFPPSHCMGCGTRLKSFDLIPVLSYLLAKGKCRYCGDKISLQYPIIEILNAFIYFLLFYKFGLSLLFIKYSILCSVLLVISIIDYNHKIIPNSINLFLLLYGIIFSIIDFSFNNLTSNLLGLFIGGGLFLLIAIITKGAMGGGDIKLVAVLGLLFGLKKILLIIFLSFIMGAIISILLLLFKIKKRKDYIPFGPFICIGGLITIIYGNNIIEWYLNTLL